MASQSTFPLLTKLLRHLQYDNDLPMLPDDQWQWPHNAGVMEAKLMLAQLTEDDLEQLALCPESKHIVTQHPELAAVDEFLNKVFDGPLSANFYSHNQ